jgi:hypothetical protein
MTWFMKDLDRFLMLFCRAKPEVAWAQRDDSLLVTFRVPSAKSPQIELTAEKLVFS